MTSARLMRHSNAERRSRQIKLPETTPTEGPNERSGKYDMDLKSDRQRNIQTQTGLLFHASG